MHLLRSLFFLVIPGVLFFAALYVQLKVVVPEDLQPLLNLFPYLSVAAGLFLGWRFNRSKVFWAVVLLIIVERSFAGLPSFGKEYVMQVAPFLLPLNLVLFAWWSERGLFTVHGLIRLAIVTLQVGIVAWIYLTRAGDAIALIERPLLVHVGFDKLHFPQLTLVVMVFSLVALLVRFYQKPDALEGAFCWVAVAVCTGFWWPDDFTFWGGVAAFLLAIALIESSFKMAFNDELTGLPARRAMNEYLLKVGRRYTVAMVDVDHFKKVNDTHGHDVGDQVLKMVATCLRRVTGGGRAYRYGGEEFAIIFAGKDMEKAVSHLEVLRENIARMDFVVRGKKRPKKKPDVSKKASSGKAKLQVTVSIGVATRDDKNTTPEQLIKAADQALYKAKKGGRNQVCKA
jgi:diguanylate cyclase (GGDEF)-like protein